MNVPPVAVDDSYAASNGTLTVNAPGILLNDTDVDLPGNALTVVLISGPTNGLLTLNSNGGFAYTPNTGFGGIDGFTYRTQDAESSSGPATVTITVTAPPIITGQPVSQTVVAGTNASFFVAASGSAPMSYQWRKNGANIPGANTSTLTLSNVQTNDVRELSGGIDQRRRGSHKFGISKSLRASDVGEDDSPRLTQTGMVPSTPL